MSSEDDDVQLRPDTLAILQQFMKEKEAAKRAFEAESADSSATLTKTTEDWQLSQFWYDEKTGAMLAQELLAACEEVRKGDEKCVIACISAPSAYKALLAHGLPPHVDAHVLEFDPRFGTAFGSAFSFYDFNKPQALPARLLGAFHVLLLDPPFLNRDTLSCYAQTVAALQRPAPAASRVYLCSGAVMLRHARELLGLRPVRAHVGHANALSNPFCLYVPADAAEAAAARVGGFDTEAEEAEARGAAEEAAAASAAAPAPAPAHSS